METMRDKIEDALKRIKCQAYEFDVGIIRLNKMLNKANRENEKLRKCVEYALRETVMHKCDKDFLRQTLKEIDNPI